MNKENSLTQQAENINSIFPSQKVLMGPGPSNLHPRVLAALSKPIIGHLDPDFIGIMDDIQKMLRYAFQTENPVTFPLSAPGSAAMEGSLANLLEKGDKAIICINGVFGGRMKDMASRIGATVVTVEDEWGAEVDLEKLKKTAEQNSDAKLIAFVQAETSTGALSNAEEIAKIAKKHSMLTIMDAVTSLAGVPIFVDKWGIDVVYSGTQKCLSCVPGLAPMTFSKKAVEVIKNRKTKVQSWFLDLSLLLGYWEDDTKKGKRAYHHTAPINPLYCLHESLVLLQQEGLEKSWERHRENHLLLKAGLKKLGVKYLIEGNHGLPQLNSVIMPDGVDEALVRKKALDDFHLELGAGLGALAGKVTRIGLMGHTSQKNNVLYCLAVLEKLIKQK